MGHRSFLSQEVVHREVWIGGLQRRHSYRQQSPQREIQCTSQPQFVV